MRSLPVIYLTESEILVIRNLMLGLSSVALVGGLFVWLTYLLFDEKRQVQLTRLVFWYTTVSQLSGLLMLLIGADRDALLGRLPWLCGLQSTLMVLLLNLIVPLWLSIFAHLYLRVRYLDSEDRMPIGRILLGSLLYSFVFSVPPLFVDNGITFDGVWCFINFEMWGLVLVCFFAGMFLVAVAGVTMWIATLARLRKAQTVLAHGALLRRNVNGLPATSSEPVVTDVLSPKRVLLLRQFWFVTAFLVSMIIVFVNYTVAAVQDTHLTMANWIIQGSTICLSSFWLFLLFGLTPRNLTLWKEWMTGVRMRSYPYESI